MKTTTLKLGILISLCGLWLPGISQGVNFFSTEPAVFIQEFTNVLNQTRNERGQAAATAFQPFWNSADLSDDQKNRIITQVNIMVSKRYRTVPDLANYALVAAALGSGTAEVDIPLLDFLNVSMEAIVNLKPEQVGKYLRVLEGYVPSGYPVKRERFFWWASQTSPRLIYLTLEDHEGSYAAPVVRFSQTDLKYASSRYGDSTLIRDTRGDFHLLSMTFVGTGGRVDWTKVNLDPEAVYCEFKDYDLNLNYGLVEVDTATFYYKGLIDRPLVGRFEDRNSGYKNINRANYPYFKSHEGGVVIENFIPNVRYEGGFSLRGVRRVGTSYDLLTSPSEAGQAYFNAEAESPWYRTHSPREFAMAELKDDRLDEEGWETEANEEAEFEAEDEYWPDDFAGWDAVETWTEADAESFDESFGPMTEHIKAALEIQRGGRTVMRLLGEAFVLDLEKMVSKDNEAIIYPSEEDSIYHPAMDMLYLAKDSTVTLKKPKRSNFKSVPFTSSYHEYFLYFETIIWDLRTDELAFTAFVDRSNKVSAIESFDYFSKGRFNQFKGMLPFNPIGAIYRYHVLHPDDPIFPGAILEEYRLPQHQTTFERALPALEGSGFIDYDKKTLEIKVKPKLIAWARAARNKKDFDAVQIISKVDTGAHAVMNLETMEIEMRGVSGFSISDSVFVRALPLGERVWVQKGRNLRFGGFLAAGKVNFYANDTLNPSFTFDYETYKIQCDSIDSLRFELVRNPAPDYEPTPLERALSNTVFEGVTGAIHIDDPNNKSGEKDYSYFPVFDSYSSSYLYWANPEIEGGVYTKDKMHFAVDPFVLDSLEDFDGTSLQFDGEFFSSEILPPFRQRLEVMEDYTLGFKKTTPPLGYRIYEGNGRLTGDIVLDGRGLRGGGSLEYLGTIAKSDSFVFHFDSVMATVNYFNLRRGYRGGVYFPQVDANSALYTWYTKDSTVSLSSTYEELSIFNGEAQFTGTLFISEKGMVGDGDIRLGPVVISGDSIVFNEMDFIAEGCDFILVNEENPDEVHFIAQNVNITYDVRRHNSAFEAQQAGAQLAQFPLHQYSTTMAKGQYAKTTHDLKLQGVTAYIKDNYFVSTDPKQDSLYFNAKDSYYNLETREVAVSGVPYIYVADATITPADQAVVIQENGLLKTLENATIEADQDTRFHRIYEARVDIFGRNEYEGGGKYDYIEVNGKKQYIQFDNIRVNSDTTTVASGIIGDSQGFYLTERIFFRGNTQLDASRKFLSFEGEVKIESENPVFKGAWFTFNKTIVNPDSVFIPIADDLTNDLGEELTAGLMFVPENRVFYSNFLQAKEDEDDVEVLTASGGLTFDRRRKEFKIGSEIKLKNQVFKGSTVAFNDEKNTITSQGFLRFPFDFTDKTITMKMAGMWKEDLRARSVESDLVIGIDLGVIPKEPLAKLSENFVFLTTANKNIDFNQRTFLESISELLDEGQRDERETSKFLANVRSAMVYTDIKLAQQLPYTVLLSGVNFRYDRDYKALFSDSEVGLIGLDGHPINKVINAKIVYQFGRIGMDGEKEPDELYLYLEVDEFNWLYFHVKDEVVYTLASYYDEYNYPLQEEIDKRKDDSGFRFEMAPEDEKARFLQDFVKKFIR
ncbi:MAG: hypothetical protein D6722_27790 [Bacteroidetes bacterium]|nr:MAG: hypothetical protein D6722_27790 [Bacteroidota bacterium]